MAFEPLLAAAFAVGVVEGISILSYSEQQLKESMNNDYNYINKRSEKSVSLTSLILPSMMYGTIALPMSIVGGSPGPAILDLLHSPIHSNGRKTITGRREDKFSTNLVPGKLPRLKKCLHSDETNENAITDDSPILKKNTNEVNRNTIGNDNDVNKIDKRNNDLSKIQRNLAAVKRLRDHNKRAIQAMKDARNKSKSDVQSQPKASIENSTKVYMKNEMQTSKSSIAYLMHPKIQYLFHVISLSSSNQHTNNYINQSVFMGSHSEVMKQYGTHIPPLAEILRRFRFLFVGSACITSAIAHYSTNNESFTSTYSDHVDKDTYVSSTESIKFSNEMTSKNDQTNSSSNFNIPSNSPVALRFMTRHCGFDNYNYGQTSILKPEGDKEVNIQDRTSIHQNGKTFHTLPVVITDEQSSDSKNDDKSSKNPYYCLNLGNAGINKWHELPMNSNWLFQPPRELNENNSSKAISPFILCEADISIPIQTYLRNSVESKSFNKTNDRLTKKDLEEDSFLTLEAVQVSTRIIDLIAHQKNIFASSNINLCHTRDDMESRSNKEEDNPHVTTNKKNDGIVNVFIQSGPSGKKLYESMNYITIDSLAAVGSSLCQRVERSYMETDNGKTQYDEMEENNDNDLYSPEKINLSFNEEKEVESSKEDQMKLNNTNTSTMNEKVTIPLLTRVGKSIRQSVTILLSKTIPKIIFHPTGNQKKVLYLFSNEVTLNWLKPYFESRGWKICWFDLRDTNNATKMIESVPAGAFSLICGPSDLSTIEYACRISSQIEKRDESTYDSFPKQMNIFTLMEKESSIEMMNALFSHTSKDSNKVVALQPICIKSCHNDAFDMARELLTNGKSAKETQQIINSALI